VTANLIVDLGDLSARTSAYSSRGAAEVDAAIASAADARREVAETAAGLEAVKVGVGRVWKRCGKCVGVGMVWGRCGEGVGGKLRPSPMVSIVHRPHALTRKAHFESL
jgi:hypothetical protein